MAGNNTVDGEHEWVVLECRDPILSDHSSEIFISTADISSWNLPFILTHQILKVKINRTRLIQHSSYFQSLLCGSFSTLLEQAPSASFLERFLWMSKNVSRGELVIFAALAWASWHCRNLKFFEQGSFNAVEVAKGWVNLVRESNEYAGKVTCRAGVVGSTIVSSWSCPGQGNVKVNCDAHLGARTGLGVVIRDEQGSVIAAAVRHEPAGWGVELAEAAACYFGLVIARRLGFVKVQLESDSINVVRAVTSRSVGFSPVYMIYEDIIRLSSYFSLFSFSHVKRVGNTLAHSVARWDARGCNEVVSLGPFPQSLTTLAEIDLI